ncbi:MAG: sugar phosphate isomerase/epimerase [Clostridia bacterium]|nr:sugar phosphate isomerase/epimerase [Clostridia bacterium]
MKISTEINSAAKHVGEEKAIELIGKAGFDCWDFSMFNMCRWDWGKNCPVDEDHPLKGDHYLAFARELKKIGEAYGMECNQSHAPFPSKKPQIEKLLKRAIECTAEAGGKICIIHPDNDSSAEQNAEMYFELLPFAKDHGVKIATENMWNWTRENGLNQAAPAACSDAASFNAHLDAVNDDNLVACLDIGHAEMKGLNATAPDMIRALGSRLQALHIHDNDRWRDLHQIPFAGSIDWNEVVKALRDVDYKGEFTLEADTYLQAFNVDNVFEGIKNMADAAHKLVDMFEGC